MENRETTKEIKLGDRIYQLNKADARSACWMFTFLAGKAEEKDLMSALGKCTKEQFDDIQTRALKLIYFMDTKDGNTFPTAVIKFDGSIVDNYLNSDPDALLQITYMSLMFNISPFLAESKLSSHTPAN